MRVLRAFAETLLPSLALGGDEAHHLGRVLRVRPGDAVEVFDGRGAARLYAVESVSKRAVLLRETGPGRPDRALRHPLTVAVAPPKGKRAQRLVEGLTELGVSELRFLECARAQARFPEPEAVQRWALEAAKQCGRHRLPETGPAWSFPELLERARGVPTVFGAPGEAQPLGQVLGQSGPLQVVVGPEGGLDDAEHAALSEAGATPVRLGPTVLRVETAALALVAATIACWESR